MRGRVTVRLLILAAVLGYVLSLTLRLLPVYKKSGLANAQIISEPPGYPVNGQYAPNSAAPGLYLGINSSGTPIYTAAGGGGGGTGAPGPPFQVNGTNVPITASPLSELVVDSVGRPEWTPTPTPAATGYNGATPYPTPATPYPTPATATPFSVNGSAVPATAAAGNQLIIGAGGTPTWGATPSPAATGYNGVTPYPTPATPYPTPTGWAVNGSVVPVTAVAGLGLVIGPGGTPTWTATPSAAATGYSGATPYPTPATPTPFALNGSAVPGTAAAGLGLIAGPGGTPTWAATPIGAYATPATPTPFALNGSAVPGTAAAGLGLIAGPGGTPTWAATPIGAYATPATPTPFAVNGSAVPGTAPAGFDLGMGPGGTPTWHATPSAAATGFIVNGSAVPGTAAVGLQLGIGAGGTPTWVATNSPGPTAYPTPAGAVASPPFFSPTAIAGLPTCTAGGVNLGARAAVNNQNCAIVFGATPLATTASQNFCIAPVFCGTRPTSTTNNSTPTIAWILGKNGKKTYVYVPQELRYPWNKAYDPGSRIPSPGLWEELGKLVAR